MEKEVTHHFSEIFELVRESEYVLGWVRGYFSKGRGASIKFKKFDDNDRPEKRILSILPSYHIYEAYLEGLDKHLVKQLRVEASKVMEALHISELSLKSFSDDLLGYLFVNPVMPKEGNSYPFNMCTFLDIVKALTDPLYGFAYYETKEYGKLYFSREFDNGDDKLASTYKALKAFYSDLIDYQRKTARTTLTDLRASKIFKLLEPIEEQKDISIEKMKKGVDIVAFSNKRFSNLVQGGIKDVNYIAAYVFLSYDNFYSGIIEINSFSFNKLVVDGIIQTEFFNIDNLLIPPFADERIGEIPWEIPKFNEFSKNIESFLNALRTTDLMQITDFLNSIDDLIKKIENQLELYLKSENIGIDSLHKIKRASEVLLLIKWLINDDDYHTLKSLVLYDDYSGKLESPENMHMIEHSKEYENYKEQIKRKMLEHLSNSLLKLWYELGNKVSEVEIIKKINARIEKAMKMAKIDLVEAGTLAILKDLYNVMSNVAMYPRRAFKVYSNVGRDIEVKFEPISVQRFVDAKENTILIETVMNLIMSAINDGLNIPNTDGVNLILSFFVNYTPLKAKLDTEGTLFKITIDNIRDTSDETRKMIYERILEIVAKDEISGTGGLVIKGYGVEEDNNMYYLFRINVHSLEPNELMIMNPIIAHIQGTKKVNKKLRKIVTMRTYTNVGICIYEAWYSIINKKTPPNSLERWKMEIYSAFAIESEKSKVFIARGDLPAFLAYKYDSIHVNIGYFDYARKSFWFPVLPTYGEGEKVILFYAGHCFIADSMLILNELNPKLPKDDDISKLILNFQMNDKSICELTSSIALYKLLPPFIREENNKEKDSKEGMNFKHIHYGLDIETYSINKNGLHKEYLICVGKLGDKPSYFYGENCIRDFIYTFLIPLTNRPSDEMHHIWTYNGSNFDCHFLYQAINWLFAVKIIGSTLQMKSIIITSNIDMLDLACWYGSCKVKKDGKVYKGLAGLAISCGSKKLKTKFEYDFNKVSRENLDDPEFKRKAIEYCSNDVDVLCELVDMLIISNYENFTYKGRKACLPTTRRYPHSAAQLALIIYKNCFLEHDIILKGSCGDNLVAERASYHGGLTIPLKKQGRNVRVMDISSSYPGQMRREMPYQAIGYRKIGKEYTIKDKEINQCNLYKISKYEYPPETILPNIMIKDDNLISVLKWQGGEKEYIYIWGVELNMAVRLKCKVFIEGEYRYMSKVIFKEYAEYFYNMKESSKGKPHLCLFYKLLLNSLYGKFGQRCFGTTAFGNIAQVSETIASEHPDKTSIFPITDSLFKIKVKPTLSEELRSIGTLVRFASYITACGRTQLILAAYRCEGGIKNVIYGDTDSLFLDNAAKLNKLDEGIGIGMFRQENAILFSKVIIFGCKNYIAFETKDNKEEIKYYKTKGIREIKDVPEYMDKLGNNEKYSAIVEPFFIKIEGKGVIVSSIKRCIGNTLDMKRKFIDNESIPYESLQEYKHEMNNKILAAKEESLVSKVLIPLKDRKDMITALNELINKDKIANLEGIKKYFYEQTSIKVGNELAELIEELFKLNMIAPKAYAQYKEILLDESDFEVFKKRIQLKKELEEVLSKLLSN